jgi:hypothetical protein
VLPTGFTEGAADEQVKGHFFNIVAAENTIVVVSI